MAQDVLWVILRLSTKSIWAIRRSATLRERQRQQLRDISRNGHAPAKKILHAQVLLMTDQDHPEAGWTDVQISEALGVHINTIARIPKDFVQNGMLPARLTSPT